MIQQGIVPALSPDELISMFESMSHKDRKIAKRKFRKLWRKFAKKNPDYVFALGYGNSNPSKTNIKNRIGVVKSQFLKKC